MDALRERLAQKGWHQRDIEKTITILEQAHQKKTPFIRILDEALIWISLIIAIIGNFVVSVILVPFLIILSGAALYTTIITLGAAFGILFILLLNAIERIEIKQHIIAGLFIPIIGLINMYIIARLTNQIITQLTIPTTEHSPALVSMVYIFAFITPSLIITYYKEFFTQKNTHFVSKS